MKQLAGEDSLIVVFVLLANALWYWARFILRRRGFEVSWFSGHFGDLINLWRSSRDEPDEYTRTNLRALLGAIILCLLLSLLGFVGFVFNE